jgi:hypothetical protein
MISERTRSAMDRSVAFWERRMSDQILASFNTEGEVGMSALAIMDGKVSEEFPALYDDIPKMLADFEAGIAGEELRGNDGIWDDDARIPKAWPELQFGNGMPGAIFGATVITTSTYDHTYTFNEPVVTDWSQVAGLRFDPDNDWVRRIDAALRYFLSHGRKEFVVQPFFIIEGTDFLVSMRGTTQAFLDMVDRPPGVRALYQLGYEVGAAWFEMKREVVRAHNERVLGHARFAELAPIHSVPYLDMDADALCSPKSFEELVFEYKQKTLRHFHGGCFYIHALGSFIVPIAAHLEELTELWLFDDPKCTPYFDRRAETRALTFDIPLEMLCTFTDFAKALEDRSLPGGVRYNVLMPGGKASVEEINRVMEKVRAYRTTSLAGRPKR